MYCQWTHDSHKAGMTNRMSSLNHQPPGSLWKYAAEEILTFARKAYDVASLIWKLFALAPTQLECS